MLSSNDNRQRKKIILFIVLSCLIHLFFVHFLKFPSGVKEKSKPLIVERILPDEMKKQVVDDTGKTEETPPKETAYLSKHNRSVKEETKSPIAGKTQNRAKISLTKPTPKETKRNNNPPPKKSLSIADLTRRPTTQSQPSSEPRSMTDDYLPDVKSGLDTALNTREFKYYSYFERIKDRLRMFWEPELKERVQRLYQRGAELPDSDVITKLTITLNKNGEISKISIIKNSGFTELDEAAIKAFERASPFPNPPSGMIEKDGAVHLTWSFVLQTRGIADLFVFLSKR